MKATTCVRVVLPTDELVRVDCAKTMTVAALVAALGRRCAPHKLLPVDLSEERPQCSGDNNADTGAEASRSWHANPANAARDAPHGELILVRMGKGLKAGSLVTEEVHQLDILEFRLVTPIFPSCAQDSSSLCSRVNKMQGSSLSSPEGTEEIRPTSTPLVPLGPMTQLNRTAREESSGNAGFSGTVSSSPLGAKRLVQLNLMDLLQRSKSGRFAAWRRWGRRRRYLSGYTRSQRVDQQLEAHQKRSRYAANRRDAERTMLRAGMQLIECLRLVQGDLRCLVFLVRDAIMGSNALAAGDLLASLDRMADTLAQASPDNRFPTAVPSGTETARQIPIAEKEALVRKLSAKVAGSDDGAGALQEGWVVSSEWGTFWRKQRKDYAFLCENHILYFFSSKTQCTDYIFELGREYSNCSSETSRRIMKDNEPVCQIDLSETDWTVRKRGSQMDATDSQQRNAFAFFDTSGSMRLVLDVTTAAEATAWIRAIAAEINRSRLLTRVHASNSATLTVVSGATVEEEPSLGEWEQRIAHFAGTLRSERSFELPLRSLYARIDRLDGKARAERHKSSTLSQALKDLQRDRIRVNGVTCSGESLESSIVALTLGIWRTTVTGHERRSMAERLGESVTNCSLPAATTEMNALSFARQLILCSSRTHGGGDILDTLHLMLGTEKFCICPDAREMEPIEIVVSCSKSAPTVLSAQITMKMTYRVIPKNSVAPDDNDDAARRSHADSYDYGRDTRHQASTPTSMEGCMARQPGDKWEQIEYRVVGIHTQRLVGPFLEPKQVKGSVRVSFAD